MSRLIIIEGPDSSGKSTLAKEIMSEVGAAYIHASGHRDLHGCMFTYHLSLLQSVVVMLERGIDVVMDRHWPSEVCYGNVLRPQLRDKYNAARMMQLVNDYKPTYIFCENNQGWEEHVRSHDAANHVYPKDEYVMIVGEYLTLAYQLEQANIEGVSVVRYNYKEDQISKVLNRI